MVRIRRITFSLMIAVCVAITGIPLNEPVYGEGTESAQSKDMRIYGIYMHRDNGEQVKTDRYGDATLIESGGQYLLIDTGASKPIKDDTRTVIKSNIVSRLRSIGVTELDIYISHMHGDHTQGLDDICKEFKVNRVYLPAKGLCAEYVTPKGITIDQIYAQRLKTINKEKAEVIYLAPESRKGIGGVATAHKLTVGHVTGVVMGPVGKFHMKDNYHNGFGSREGVYLNNTSLSTMFTCGKTKYLTCGDIEKQEENALIQRYGSKLDADIFKMNHHSLDSSNQSKFMSRVTPRWSYAEDHGYWGTNNDYSLATALKYGYIYKVAANKANFIIDVRGDTVRIYHDKNNNGKIDERPVTGWVKCGNRYQHYAGDGAARTAWAKIGGSTYYFSKSSGFRYGGTHTIGGVRCKFDSKCRLISPKKPTRAAMKGIKAGTGAKITVYWKQSIRANGYQIYRSKTKNGTYTKVGTASKKARSFTDKRLKKGQRYYYKVRGTRTFGGLTQYGNFSNKKYTMAK